MKPEISPANPFGEPGSEDELFTLSLYSPERRLAAELLTFMELFPENVVVESNKESPHPNATRRSITIACSAPYRPKLGVFINPSAPEYAQRESDVRVGAIITGGEGVSDETLSKRWVQLRRADGKPFGVAGVSREMGRGNGLEQWTSLTTLVWLEGSEVKMEHWGELPDTDECVMVTPFLGEIGGHAHAISLSTALERTSEKRTQY